MKSMRKLVYVVSGREYKNRGRLAQGIMAWGNLVFVGLVLAQALSDQKDYTLAGAGALLFVGAYLFAQQIMKGGEK